MSFILFAECTLDFQRVSSPSGKLPMTWRAASVQKNHSPVINFAQVPSAEIGEQLENSIKKHTLAVQQDTKMPVTRTFQVQICHGDPSITKRQNSAFLRIIDDYSRDKQYGILGQLISVSGGSDNVTADVTLEFGTTNDKDKMMLNLKGQRIAQYLTKNAHEVTHWFDFTDAMIQSWTGNSKFVGTLTLKLQLNDKALNIIRQDELKGSQLFVLTNMLQEAEATGDGYLVTANGSFIPCHKAVLMAQSEVFKAMFNSGMKEQTTSTVELDDMTEIGVRAFLAYLYCSDITKPLIDCEIALELIKAADKYGFKILEEAMKDVILNKEASWCTVSTAINLWSFARKKEISEESDTGGYKEIEKKAINTLKSKTKKELEDCPEFHETLTCPQFAKDMCVYLLLSK